MWKPLREGRKERFQSEKELGQPSRPLLFSDLWILVFHNINSLFPLCRDSVLLERKEEGAWGGRELGGAPGFLPTAIYSLAGLLPSGALVLHVHSSSLSTRISLVPKLYLLWDPVSSQ